jgi:putative ABC transport system substrate-binding protein
MQFGQLRRRQFITLLGTAAAWPIAVRGQQPGKLPIIGFLDATSASTQGYLVSVFAQRLRELGWSENRNLTIEVRWAEGRQDRYAEIAAEFVRLKVDMIVTYAVPAILAVKQATSVIPIVFASANDPVGNGLVASLARPGGNVTGLSNQSADIAGKRIELLREIVPGLTGLAILVNVTAPNALLEHAEVAQVARALGFETRALEIRRADDIGTAFAALKEPAQALYVVIDPLTNTNRIRINTLALGARLPTMYAFREFVQSGGLMSYGANLPALYRRAAEYADKILRGAKPADLPVEQPTKFDLIINATTAKALGLAVPDTLLARADEVIE